jgi:DNA-binding transcriptional MocR family regulator
MPQGQAGSRTSDVMTAIRSKIAGRALLPGDRLPSIRGFMTALPRRG